MSDTPLGAELARIEEIFAAALEIADPAARRAYVAAATAGESALEQEILSLLAADAAGAALFGESAEGPAEEPPAELPPAEGLTGSRLGNFAVGAEIGRGGMATVYDGRRVDGELRQEVAIKVLRLAGEELRARFRAERQTLVGLRHPFIVAPLDAGTTPGGQPYLVLEKVDGRPLLDFCRERLIGLEARLELFEKVCLAVGHAHRRLVVHRDLKPGNILVDREGQPRLLDFGVAKLLGPSAGPAGAAGADGDAAEGDLTGTAGAPFTPRYASPEQIRGEPAATTSDVYSLGVVLFELLTLEAADDPGEAPSAAVRSRSRLAPGAREELARRLAGDLDAVAAKARAADPARRYLSADALREDLERRRRHLPLLAREPHRASYRLGRFLRRHRSALAIAAGLAIALLAAAILARRAEERAVASEAIAWRAHAEAAWASQTLGRLLADLAAPGELSGEGLARARADAAAALAGTEQLLLKAGDKAPEAEARLRHALALVYARIGRREEAIGHARRAAQLARGTRGLGPEDLEANLQLLAELGGEEQ